MKELELCPFCGGKAFLGQYQTNFFATLYAVRCKECNSVGKSFKTEEEAMSTGWMATIECKKMTGATASSGRMKKAVK